MYKLNDAVTFISGSPQFRIKESSNAEAVLYNCYSQTDLSDDLFGVDSVGVSSKQIHTLSKVNLLSSGDVIFSLISGTAAIVGESHDQYLFTQNYIKVVPNKLIDTNYLVYILNENKFIRKQFMVGLQGSQVLKFTLKQLKELEIPKLPPIDRQKLIGDIYLKQLKVQALKSRVVELETTVLLKLLEEEK